MKRRQPLPILIILITLFKLYGCSGQTKGENKISTKDSLEEQINRSIEEFEKRPIYKNLTEKIIDGTPDEELLQVVFDNLTEKLPREFAREYGTVLSWTKPRQAIFVIWWLEAEVNNGGYNQFYSNSSGQYNKILPEALKLIGANKFADLTERANKTYEQEKERITKHQDGTVEGFSKSYEDNPLNKYDTEFYDLYKTENLNKLQVDFIRKNKTEFVDK